MEEYIRLEEEKARKHGKVFNWETAKYGKICYDKDVHDLRSVETEFPAIVFNDNLTLNETLFYEPTVSSLNNNEINFRISFDESDDEDYMVVFDKNSFSYKIISTNDLKTDSENDNEKVNMPLFPSPEPSIFSTKTTLCPQHIDEFDLKDETSLFEYDEVEQNILYFNDLFPFNIIYPDDLKSDKGDDDNEIDMIQSSGGKLVSKNGYDVLDMALPLRYQRHQYLRYEGLQYTNAHIVDFEMRLARIYMREREVLDSMAHNFSRFTTWTVTSLARLMDRACMAYTRYSELPVEYQRHNIRQRTDEPSTSTTLQHHDP
ncbi:hypothetical protein Tco_0892080 [Tanacetum coccineum]|uniref:Uncharacterized protein n=1 Tax=Tanacetum coccineum TaxID=301880 RepID=A0ABQ5C7Z5_9ASTR